MVNLKKLTEKNVWDIINLRVNDSQRYFVDPNYFCIIEAFAAANNNGRIFAFGIYEDDTPIGFCLVEYSVDDSWDDAPEIAEGNYYLWQFMIDAAFQGKGYGEKALGLLLEFIESAPCGESEYIWLAYSTDDVAAQRMYRKFGFSKTGGMDRNLMIAARPFKLLI